MNYIVFDLEWNQPVGEVGDGPKFEIVEIGAVKLDENFNRISDFSSFIKPMIYKEMNPYIQTITGIAMDDLKDAETFSDVIRRFAKWCGKESVFVTFGNQDLYELQSNMEYYGITPESLGFSWRYPLKYLDIQKIFGMLYTNYMEEGERLYSLEDVMKYFRLPIEKQFHRAVWDAEYTTVLMQNFAEKHGDIFRRYFSIDTYCIPKNIQEEREEILKGGTYDSEKEELVEVRFLEYISTGFQTKEELQSCKRIRTTRCVFCGKKCLRKMNWFSDNGKHICVAYCKTHGYLEGMIHFRVTPYTHKHYAVRRVWGITSEAFEKIVDRKKLVKERRRQKRQRQKHKI